jgi:hypothetical protein
MKKWLLGLFLILLLTFFAFAAKSVKKTETNWEVLEISDVTDCRLDFEIVRRECRSYNYLTFGTTFKGLASLEWLKESGWELVGILSSADSADKLYLKRRYDKLRTEKEIARLKNEFKTSQARSNLIDLDDSEFQQQIRQFKQEEIAKLKTALEQIGNPSLKIMGVESDALSVREQYLRAEIVLDGTSTLFKEGGTYRSSEADKYFQENGKQILEKINLSANAVLFSNAQRIAKGAFIPVKIGEFRLNYSGIALKISVVVNHNNQQIIVAQGWVYGRWATNQK